MQKYHKQVKIICLFIFTALSFFFLALQYQKINAGYNDTNEVTISRNEKIKTNNVEFKILNTSIDKKHINVTLDIKKTGPGFYGMKKSDNFFESMWIANMYDFSEHNINENLTDQYNHVFDMNKYSSGQNMIAKVSFYKSKLNKNSKFYFLVQNDKNMTKYSLSLN
ncbi:hypothetical protein [Companilactobacillus keshanensis]|uniref:DUF4352 domain-containing protein n=1 Tax=Companilactobacillus keshanensis TaxID=2486003 RepID=A0ABW4BS29_9LACO|nr:hypothetical protein [Companilactobacillus keshanensis]